jgi:hypothetical protein
MVILARKSSGIDSEEAWAPACAGVTEFFSMLARQQGVVIPM